MFMMNSFVLLNRDEMSRNEPFWRAMHKCGSICINLCKNAVVLVITFLRSCFLTLKHNARRFASCFFVTFGMSFDTESVKFLL